MSSLMGPPHFLPALFNNYYQWTSSYQTTEMGQLQSQTVTPNYYPFPITPSTFTLNRWGHREIYMGSQGGPSPWRGSGNVIGWGQLATAIHHQNGSMGTLGYLGTDKGAKQLVLPYFITGQNGWKASITVQNTGITSTNVYMHLYTDYGTFYRTYGPYSIDARKSKEFYAEFEQSPGVPIPFIGSVIIESTNSEVSAVVHGNHLGGDNYGYMAVP